MPKAECKVVLSGPPDCQDYTKKRSYAACYAWKMLRERKISSWGEGLHQGWEAVNKVCEV